MTRSRLDRKASAKEAVAKGSTGDGAVKAILQSLGWRQVVRLSRTNPGCDLVAVCGCAEKHILWAEVKTYPSGGIEGDSWNHLVAFAREVYERPREAFALFTYQAARGGARRKGESIRRAWWASIDSIYPGARIGAPNHRPFIGSQQAFAPPCGTPLPMGMVSNPPAPLISADSGAARPDTEFGSRPPDALAAPPAKPYGRGFPRHEHAWSENGFCLICFCWKPARPRDGEAP